MADEFVNRITNPQATAATTPAAPCSTSGRSASDRSPGTQTPAANVRWRRHRDPRRRMRPPGKPPTLTSILDPETPDDEDNENNSAAGGFGPARGGHRHPTRHDRPHPVRRRRRTRHPHRLRPHPRTNRPRLIRTANPDTKTWIRRLYTDPRHRAPHQRRRANAATFPHATRQFLLARDQHCRTPWCDAPSGTPTTSPRTRRGGPTTITNGQGICEHCNYVKESPGWTATAPNPTATPSPSPPPPATPSAANHPHHPRSIHWIEQSVIEQRLYSWLLAS